MRGTYGPGAEAEFGDGVDDDHPKCKKVEQAWVLELWLEQVPRDLGQGVSAFFTVDGRLPSFGPRVKRPKDSPRLAVPSERSLGPTSSETVLPIIKYPAEPATNEMTVAMTWIISSR